jgi:YVTN family beta-propeller protein
MMNSKITKSLSLRLLTLSLAVLTVACRKNDGPEPYIPEPVTQGMFILNEGNWNANNSTLDYYVFQSGTLNKDVYGKANADAKLGDVGQDVKIYGSRLYIIVNGSNTIEVANLNTFKSIKSIKTIVNPRGIAFYQNKALISSYDDKVYVVDTTSLEVEKSIAVGRDPEQLVVVGNKLYVANSGGSDYPANYDNTVSVVDLTTFTEIKKIPVAINLNKIVADKSGDVYVTSRGDYGATAPNLYVIDTKTDAVKKNLQIPATDLAIHDNTAYIYKANYRAATNNYDIGYLTLNVETETVISDNFIEGTTISLPYGIGVDPVSGDVYIADAKDFQNPGEIFCFDKTGKKKASFMSGGFIPGHFAFYTK